MVQTVQLEETVYKRNPRDVLGYINYQYKTNPHYQQVMHEKRVDVLIHSIHGPEVKISSGHGDVSIISYVPEIGDTDWPEFYVRLCMSKIIACDSFVKKALDAVEYPRKRWINLDGVDIRVKSSITPTPVNATLIGHLGSHPLWNNYVDWLNRQEAGKYDLKPTSDVTKAGVVVSFKPIGALLANAVSKQALYFWTAYNEGSCLFLDGRHTHNHDKRFAQATNMQGAAGSKVLTDAFELFSEEINNLFIHSSIVQVPTFVSNVDIVERIINELNRA